jgi:hypothetical protein
MMDFVDWTRQNAELLRSGRASEADLEHIAEEIEDMGKRERRRRTILVQRRSIRRLLEENPSFRPILAEVVAAAYDDAAAMVTAVTGSPRASFPAVCRFTFEAQLDEQFLPAH